jgi:hypothetical protein
MATLYPFLRWGYEITQPLRHAAPRGVWFEKIGEAPSDGEVELRFVDEAGNPAEFSALLFWEPTGEAEEVYIRGRLRLPKRKLANSVDKWKEFLGGQPPKTENTLLTILPISTPRGGTALHSASRKSQIHQQNLRSEGEAKPTRRRFLLRRMS